MHIGSQKVLFDEDDPIKDLYIIREGTVELYKKIYPGVLPSNKRRSTTVPKEI